MSLSLSHHTFCCVPEDNDFMEAKESHMRCLSRAIEVPCNKEGGLGCNLIGGINQEEVAFSTKEAFRGGTCINL